MTETYNIQTYGASPNEGGDATPAVRQALQAMRGQKAARLVFPQGRYQFYPDRAAEQYLFVSNNDEGLKRIAFPLMGVSDLEIDGQGSEFLFHGGIVPFAVQNAHGIRLQNFSVDWERTFHNEAEVLAAARDTATGLTQTDLRLTPAFPFEVKHERLIFTYEGEKPTEKPLGNVLEYDPSRRETAFQVTDNYALGAWHRAEQIGADVVRLTANFSTVPTPGNIAVIGGGERLYPGFILSDSEDVALTDVTIHHCGGMGVIAQRTDGIKLERVRVTPRAGRMVSCTADATHFVNCRGLIQMTDCLFENQQDDATNVHGIYARISQTLSETEVEVELVHPQQLGIDITQAGDTLEFLDNECLATYHEAGVASVERLNKQFSRITLTSPLPSHVKPGDAVASLGWTPDMTMRGCTTRGNRARGILISTPGKVLIEGNHFHSPGAAISIAGDANYWFESGGVRDLTIRNNHFDNCSYGVWGRACIDIGPEIAPEQRTETYYHRNIKIEGNTFDVFDPRLLRAHCVDRLTFQGNIVRLSEAYPAPAEPGKQFDVTDSRHVEIG